LPQRPALPLRRGVDAVAVAAVVVAAMIGSGIGGRDTMMMEAAGETMEGTEVKEGKIEAINTRP
jgi:hypothetical protein